MLTKDAVEEAVACGNVPLAARKLGVTEQSLRHAVWRYGLWVPRPSQLEVAFWQSIGRFSVAWRAKLAGSVDIVSLERKVKAAIDDIMGEELLRLQDTGRDLAPEEAGDTGVGVGGWSDAGDGGMDHQRAVHVDEDGEGDAVPGMPQE